MTKIKYNLIDSIFSHDEYSVAGRKSEYIEWDRTCINKDIPTFFSHEKMYESVKDFKYPYGFIFESKAIIPDLYNNIEKHLNKFIKVFTHSQELINKYDNCVWIPGGGVWIGGSYGGGQLEIFEKNKLCSIVSSKKQMCDLHKFRLNIIKNIDAKNIDVFGIDKWTPINETLENYMFSIIVENYKDELYFTEKILNCFATGTIPIYYGAKKIDEKFDKNGIISFENEKELQNILDNINTEIYYSKIEAIKKNFAICKNYLSIEDYIYKHFFQ